MAQKLAIDQRVEIEGKAYELRCLGKSLRTIARELGVSHDTVWKALGRVTDRTLAKLKDAVERQKVEQSELLDTIIEEAMVAWEESKLDEESTTTRTKRMSIQAKGKDVKPAKPEKPATRQGRGRRDDFEEDDPYNEDQPPGFYLNADGEETTPAERAALLAAVGMDAEGNPLSIVEEVATEHRKGQTGNPIYLKRALDALAAKRAIWGLDAPKAEAAAATVIIKVYEGENVADMV